MKDKKTTKQCTSCKEVKDRSEYYPRVNTYTTAKGELRTYPSVFSACKKCWNARCVRDIQDIRVKNPERYKEKLLLHSKTNNRWWHKTQASPEGREKLLSYKRARRDRLKKKLAAQDAEARANPLANKLHG